MCRSVFYLPKPRPLNYLVAERYGGPALVLQVCPKPLQATHLMLVQSAPAWRIQGGRAACGTSGQACCEQTLRGSTRVGAQGARDPLNDAVQRASAIAAACPNVRVQLLDGGHWRAPRPHPCI